jgi:hypothetical protein
MINIQIVIFIYTSSTHTLRHPLLLLSHRALHSLQELELLSTWVRNRVLFYYIGYSMVLSLNLAEVNRVISPCNYSYQFEASSYVACALVLAIGGKLL